MPRVRRPPANVERVGKHKEWIVSETTAGGEQGETGGEGQSAEETETTVFKKPEAKVRLVAPFAPEFDDRDTYHPFNCNFGDSL